MPEAEPGRPRRGAQLEGGRMRCTAGQPVQGRRHKIPLQQAAKNSSDGLPFSLLVAAD